MNLFIAIGLLFGMFTTGKCRTCIKCNGFFSNNAHQTCSRNFGEMICPQGIQTCMTWMIHVTYERSYALGLPHSHIYKQRGCAPEDIVSSISSGDHCVEQSVADAYLSAEYFAVPNPFPRSHTITNVTDVTFCFCDSADNCTPPSGDSTAVGAESVSGSREVEGSTEASGDLRSCITCKEITSDGNIIDPGATELVSCSDNPGVMICPEGISTCMTGVVNIAYMLRSGQIVTLTDKRLACAPEDVVASTSPGDHCVDRSVVGAYFSDNDPAELYPDTEEMMFDRLLNATFCVCDSADKCTPPSPAIGAKALANTGGADSHTKPTNSARNLESTLGLFICSIIYALFCGLMDMR